MLRRTFGDPTRPWAWLFLIFVVAGGVAWADYDSKAAAPTCGRSDRDNTWLKNYTTQDPRRPSLNGEPDKSSTDLLDKRLELYRDSLASLTRNLESQLVCLVFALVCLRISFRRDEIAVPLLGVSVPTRLAYVVVPTVGLFFWLFGGYLLDHLIQQRAFLWTLIDTIENELDPTTQKPSILSYRLLLEDRSFMDVWFMVFERGCLASAPRTPWLVRFLLGGWMVFHGVLHAAVLALLSSPYRYLSANRGVRLGLLVGAMVLIAGSEVTFVSGYPSWAPAPMVAAMFVGLALLRRWEKEPDAERVPRPRP